MPLKNNRKVIYRTTEREHKKAVSKAKKENKSFNQWLLDLIAKAVKK